MLDAAAVSLTGEELANGWRSPYRNGWVDGRPGARLISLRLQLTQIGKRCCALPVNSLERHVLLRKDTEELQDAATHFSKRKRKNKTGEPPSSLKDSCTAA